MTRPTVFNWIAADSQAICLTQSTAGAANLIINGTLGTASSPNITGKSPTTQPIAYAVFKGIKRVISLTSVNDLHLSNFTIVGLLNGNIVSETRVGPNNNTVQTTQVFDTVTSVSVDSAVAAVSVGSGSTGYTDWFKNNYYTTGIGSVGIQVVITGTITYTFQLTLDDVSVISTPTVFPNIVSMTNATTNEFATALDAMNYCNIDITASTGAATLKASFLERGIASG